jgi:hypothetical protein
VGRAHPSVVQPRQSPGLRHAQRRWWRVVVSVRQPHLVAGAAALGLQEPICRNRPARWHPARRLGTPRRCHVLQQSERHALCGDLLRRPWCDATAHTVHAPHCIQRTLLTHDRCPVCVLQVRRGGAAQTCP